MRVISGSARGRKLVTPEGLATRPTTDRIKETLFNIIAFDLRESKFLDLFSGSGGIGIEALSRGASEACFVDFSMESIGCIKQNLEATRLFDKAGVLEMDVFSALELLARQNKKFDIVFMDPPYNMQLVDKALRWIEKGELLSEDGFIIAEMDINEDIPRPDKLKVYRVKDYKTNKMVFYRLEG